MESGAPQLMADPEIVRQIMSEELNKKRERIQSDLEIFLSNGYVSAHSVLRMLSEHGVVIKVDRVLPLTAYQNEVSKEEEVEIYYTAQLYMLKAGYEAVEPLIGETEWQY